MCILNRNAQDKLLSYIAKFLIFLSVVNKLMQ